MGMDLSKLSLVLDEAPKMNGEGRGVNRINQLLEDRHMIETAKCLVQQVLNVSETVALRKMRRQAYHSNCSVADVARAVVRIQNSYLDGRRAG